MDDGGKNFDVEVYKKLVVRRVLDFGGEMNTSVCDTTAGFLGDGYSFKLLLTETGTVNYFEYVLLLFLL
jgi:hypothetical protein